MKCCTQVYARNSLEAVRTYCKAFGAKATPEMFNEAHTEYEHCELSVGENPILAVAEAPEEWDVGVIQNMRWQTMTFNAFELGSVEAVKIAFDVLGEGGVVIEEIHEVPWNSCCATIIDRYGVCWWIAV